MNEFSKSNSTIISYNWHPPWHTLGAYMPNVQVRKGLITSCSTHIAFSSWGDAHVVNAGKDIKLVTECAKFVIM